MMVVVWGGVREAPALGEGGHVAKATPRGGVRVGEQRRPQRVGAPVGRALDDVRARRGVDELALQRPQLPL